MQKKYNYIFGPVPSRRLGMSLGLDMVPHKTCSLNCAYCECGKTTTFSLERKPYIPADKLISELDIFMQESDIKIDAITFGGSGEPLLNSDIRIVIDHIKRKYPHIKTALLTNSSLFFMPEVRKEVLDIDYVLPSYDAYSEEAFKKINNPTTELTAQMITDGLIEFSKEYKGILWVEVFILDDVNDNPEEIENIKKVLTAISPNRVQLNTLDRPGAFNWVKPASKDTMASVASQLAPLPVEIVSRSFAPETSDKAKNYSDEDIISTISRRPLTVEDIAITMQISINDADKILSKLVDEKKLKIDSSSGQKFYSIS